MAHSPALRPDPSEPGPAPPSEQEVAVGNEPDLAVMTSTIAAQGIESSELALDLILHDIAERARLSTGASGAAIALEREGSMVCRAAAGATAPDLGVTINIESGLTGACVREERAQWCPDSEADDRVDAEACRQLQVRSIAVVPLFAHERVMGVFEIFSGEPRAFGERELRGLQELAVWVTEAVKSGGTKAPQRTDKKVELANPSPLSVRAESTLVPLLKERPARARNDDHGTKALRAIVLSLAVLLCLLLGFRWGWQRAHLARELNPPAPANAPVDATEQPTVENQISAQHSKPSPAGEREAQTLGGLRLYQSGSVPAKPASGKKENASDREVLSEKPKTGDASPKSRSEQTAGQEAGQTSAPVDNVPLPSPETLARLRTAPPLPPLTVDVRSIPSPLGVPVSQGVTAGRLIRRVNPTYPSAALQQRISGPVVLQARIGKDGRVHDVKVVRGHPFLATAAVDALRQWQYEPYKLNGQPVDLQTQVTINFNLPN
jgi:TonB family protein